METLIHADIFFLISSVALVLISIALVIALVYLIKILRDVSAVSTKVKEEGIEIINDMKELRGDIKKEGFRMGKMAKFFLGVFRKRKHRQKESE